jgi:hypothetical protein
MRRKYVVDAGTQTVNHLTITSCGLRECIDRVVEASGWKEWRGRAGDREMGRTLPLSHSLQQF